ncbi:endonuclease/exonuclease/phosphatase family protein [Winogradskyella sp.]|uniref:endonuclease/exonuclease/phosphatase family protein n=1 Tax=Winogradskyella sp. TaxID=1883156 RepID=UPI00261D192B|nr:endonuclease/exonuclease/phosphatase family protein [Winogradskyella sp.]
MFKNSLNRWYGTFKTKKIGFKDYSFLVLILIPIVNVFLNLGFISVLISVLYPIFYFIAILIAIYSLWKKDYIYLFVLGACLIYIMIQEISIGKNDSNIDSTTMSILTYNVNAFKNSKDNSNTDLPSKIVQFINDKSPDICILQESTYKVGLNIKAYGYQFLGFRDSLEKSLLTIFSKYPIIDNGFVDFPNTRNNAIYADILVKEDTIRVYNTHLQSYRLKGNLSFKEIVYNLNTNYSKQIEQAHILKSHANKGKKPTIICGDFNATAFSYPYKIIKRNMNSSFSYRHIITGKTYGLFNYPMRIDHFLYNNHINLVSQDNFQLKLSDHEPIFVNITIN